MRKTFLNGYLVEDVYMSQPIGFEEVGKEHMVCKLQKSIYGLKQDSRQWYLKFDKVVLLMVLRRTLYEGQWEQIHILGFIC